MSTNAQTITSRDNSLLRLARAVRDGKNDDLIFIEGLRLCEEALRARLNIEAIIYSDEIAEKERAATFIRDATDANIRLAMVDEKLLATISYTKTPQGLIALASRPKSGPEVLQNADGTDGLILIMHGINNPVNVGAMLRSAEAAGVEAVIATRQTSDPYSPKSLRGAMGSAFRLPVWFGATYEQALDWCAERGIRTICTDVNAQESYTDVDWTQASALIVGPEARGLSESEVSAADLAIRIPMHGEVESLNVGVATAIALYEARRQREL
jgi:RNA methyltransferase, TrmH family